MDSEKFDRLIEINKHIRDIKDKREGLEQYIEKMILDKSQPIISITVREADGSLNKFIDDILTVVRSHYNHEELEALEKEFESL